ncbi:wolframin isoform X3 [Petromyzon marinus]|uniref:wolframin isoform X3 n=1 Tax=Petromyzon marinus TaxID=7757 RepID=UPI003F70FEC6
MSQARDRNNRAAILARGGGRRKCRRSPMASLERADSEGGDGGGGGSGDVGTTSATDLNDLKQRARDGSADAQVELARHYFAQAEEGEEELHSTEGVGWLLRAAAQGHALAVRLLRRCQREGRGLTEENRERVRELAQESAFERSVRRASLLLYWRLNPQRKARVAPSELLENVPSINAHEAASRTPLPKLLRQQSEVVTRLLNSNADSRSLSEADFLQLTGGYARGLPPAGRAAMAATSTALSDGNRGGGRSAPYGMTLRDKLLRYPLGALLDAKEQALEAASRAGLHWLQAALPTQQLNALLVFLVVSRLTLDFFALAVPLAVFALAFATMVVCTLKVFQSGRAWDDFRTWTELLRRFEPALSIEEAESEFGWTHLEPYLHFILAVFFVIFSLPLTDRSWLPTSELALISAFFSTSIFLSLRQRCGPFTTRTFLTQVAASAIEGLTLLPGEDLVSRALCMLGTCVHSVSLGGVVHLHLGLPTLLYAHLIYLLYCKARERRYRGIYCYLVPYLVCFLWWELAVVLLWDSTALGLFRASIGYFLFVFALPVLAVGAAVGLAVQSVRWFLTLGLTKVGATALLAAMPLAGWLAWRHRAAPVQLLRSLGRSSLVKLALVWLTATAVFCWLYVFRSEGLKVYNSTLTWSQYGSLCGPRAWRETNMARVQMLCGHLQGHRVTWSGRFKYVRVTEVDNTAETSVDMLPTFLGDWLRCVYGERYPACNSTSTTGNNNGNNGNNSDSNLGVITTQELCQLKSLTRHDCHMKKFDRYKFEITVGMPIPPKDGATASNSNNNNQTNLAEEDPTKDVVLRASGEFRAALLPLKQGSVIEFSTVLEGRLGSKWPAFELRALRCLSCIRRLEPAATSARQEKVERDWRAALRSALRFAFDFFCSPVLSAA